MTKLRPFYSLTEKDQGVAIVREEIKKEILKLEEYNKRALFPTETSRSPIDPERFVNANLCLLKGLKKSIYIHNDCLDIATLGEIDMKGGDA